MNSSMHMLQTILGDPGAVSRAGRKGATKVFKHGRKSPWVPTLTGPFPKGQANAGSRWLGTKNALYYCAQWPNSFSWVVFVSSYMTAIRELKQQRRWLLQKRHLKSEFSPFQTLSRLFHLVYFVKCWLMFLELNSKGLYQSWGKEKKVVVLCSRPRQNVNLGTFTL